MAETEMFDLVRCTQNVDFIKQTIDPIHNKTRPAPLLGPTSIQKTIDLSGTWKVHPDTGLLQERVASNGGLVLFFPKNGVNSIYHMGIIPQNAVSTSTTGPLNNGGFPAGNIPSDDDFSYVFNNVSATNQSGVGSLTFTRALAVPRIESSYGINASPDLATEFSFARQYGAYLELWSSTTSTTNVSFNGTCSTAVISDTRDICQTTNGDDAFSVTDMMQTARTPKERVNRTTIQNGIIQLQGNDVPTEYTPPNAVNTDYVFGGWDDITTKMAPYNNTFSVNNGGNLGWESVLSQWITPWGVDHRIAQGAANILAQPTLGAAALLPRVEIDPLDEMGIIDIDFQMPLTVNNPAVGVVLFRIIIDHWFAYVKNSQTGELGYTVLHTSQTLTSTISEFTGLNPSDGSPSLFTATGGVPGSQYLRLHSSVADQVAVRGGLASIGKFIGAKLHVFAQSSISSAAPNDQATFEITDELVHLKVRARKIYGKGKLGPCHIMRYDRIGTDQEIQFTGALNCECVAKGDLAPYVQDAVMNSAMSCDINVYPVIYALYNGKTPFKMSWDRGAWNIFRQMIEKLSPAELLEMANKDSRVISSFGAAGIFSGVGKMLGGKLGGLGGLLGDAGKDVAGYVGDVAGSVLSSATGLNDFGFAGQFGQNRGAGQFGACGGYDQQASSVGYPRGRMGSAS